MSNKQNNTNDELKFPFNTNGKSNFNLPNNYFDEFEHKLKQKIDFEAELNEFPVLNSVTKNNVFALPNNYFKVNEHEINYQLELIAYPKLQEIKPRLNVLNDIEYFKNSENAIINSIEKLSELQEFETLITIKKQNFYAIPQNYFEASIDVIKEKIYQPKYSILHEILNFIFSKKSVPVFAILALIITTWIFYPKANSIKSITEDCKTLACLQKQEILNNTKLVSKFDDEQLMDLVNINDLTEQLQNTNAIKNTETEKTTDDTFLINNADDILEEL